MLRTFSHEFTHFLEKDIRKPLSTDTLRITRREMLKLLNAIPAEVRNDILSNWGDIEYEGSATVVQAALDGIMSSSDNDVDLITEIINEAGYGKKELTGFYQTLRKTLGYDGVISSAWGDAGMQYVVFQPEQIKSATDNIGTFDGSNPDIRYQKRTGTLTNRDILAETNDTALQNDAERELMKKYREKLGQSKEQNRKMEELGQQIARIQSEKTPQSQKKLRELKDEQIKTKNRIDIFEAQIKRLEKSVSMDSILTREKDRILQSLWNEYGKLPKGENAVRNDTLPASIDEKNKVSRTARTVKGAAVTPDDFADRAFFHADGRIIRILLIYFIQRKSNINRDL